MCCQNGQGDRRCDERNRQDPCQLGHRCCSCTARHGSAATAAAHAQSSTFGALQQNYGNKTQGQEKVDDEYDVFHRILRRLAEYRAVNREDWPEGQGLSLPRSGQRPPGRDLCAMNGLHWAATRANLHWHFCAGVTVWRGVQAVRNTRSSRLRGAAQFALDRTAIHRSACGHAP